MRKPAFCIFLWPLYSDIIFFIDHYCAGVSNKHCLLPFFIILVAICMNVKHFVLGFLFHYNKANF